MVPYHIQCATCHRTLTVRSAAAIGKILACPQCGSMVMVEPPAGASAPPAAAPPARRAPTGAFEDDGSLESLLTAPDSQQADTVPDPLAQQIPLAPPQPKSADAAPPAAPPAPVRPSTEWASDEARQLRKWLMIGAVSIAVSVLVIVGVGLWIAGSSGGRGRQDVAKSGDSEPPPPDNTANGDAQETPADPDTPQAPATSDGDAATVEPTPPQSPGDTTPPAAGQPAAGDPGTSPPPDAPADPKPPATGETDGAAAPVAPGNPAAPPAGVGGARPGLSADAVLKEFEGLLADSAFDRGAAKSVSLFDLIPAPNRTFDPARAMPKPPPARAVNVEAQLGIRIPQMEFTAVPLLDFLQFVGDFVNLPVTVDVDGLHRLGVPVMTPVDVKLADADLRSGILQAIEPLGLALQIEGNHVIILPSDASSVDTRTYDVFDLVGEDPAAIKFLSQIIQDYLAPTTWEQGGGPGKFVLERGRMTITHTPLMHHEILMLCERLRIARGDRPQGSLPAHMLELQPRVSLALTQLGLTVSTEFAAPVPLTEILSYLSESTGVQFVVNWRALQTLGWTPASLARVELADATLSDTLQELLGPMELSFRVIDDQTIQITTAKEAFQVLEVELFRVGSLDDEQLQRLSQGVRSILGDPALSRDAAGAGQFDVSSPTLVLVAPQNRIAAVASLLDRLTEASKDEPSKDVLPAID